MSENSPAYFHGALTISLRGRGDALRLIEGEIRREKAEALGRAGERLEGALNALDGVEAAITKIDDRLRHGTGTPEKAASLREARRQLVDRRVVLRDRANLAYQYLVIQREAVGVRSHHDVDRCYRIAERLR
jgi:hypothetical protein